MNKIIPILFGAIIFLATLLLMRVDRGCEHCNSIKMESPTIEETDHLKVSGALGITWRYTGVNLKATATDLAGQPRTVTFKNCAEADQHLFTQMTREQQRRVIWIVHELGLAESIMIIDLQDGAGPIFYVTEHDLFSDKSEGLPIAPMLKHPHFHSHKSAQIVLHDFIMSVALGEASGIEEWQKQVIMKQDVPLPFGKSITVDLTVGDINDGLLSEISPKTKEVWLAKFSFLFTNSSIAKMLDSGGVQFDTDGRVSQYEIVTKGVQGGTQTVVIIDTDSDAVDLDIGQFWLSRSNVDELACGGCKLKHPQAQEFMEALVGSRGKDDTVRIFKKYLNSYSPLSLLK